MNDAAPDGGSDGAAPALREPLTIADAARRAGVHPNTVRRLIRQGRVTARLVRGRYGDTWLVESTDIDRAVGGHAPPGTTRPAAAAVPAAGPQPAQQNWSGPIDSPDFLPAGTDLSLDRARALERYTHGLLQPLVDLLREREASLESRDTLIRTQAERIGRLERELELVREAQVPAPMGQPLTAWQWPTGPLPPPPTVAPPSDDDDLPEHVSTLASQVGRLRAELQLIATALRPDEGEAPTGRDADSVVHATPEAHVTPEILPEPPPPSAAVTPAVTPEELASLFPSASRGRLTLEPLHNGQDVSTPDPFAQAEAAVQELRQALAPERARADGSSRSPDVEDPTAAPSPSPSPSPVEATPEPRARRWWWPW